MNTPTYQSGEITFGYKTNCKKWCFEIPSLKTTFLAKCPNRFNDASRVASILIGAVKRGSIDGLARENIRRLGVI